jgi:hypothetical protein
LAGGMFLRQFLDGLKMKQWQVFSSSLLNGSSEAIVEKRKTKKLKSVGNVEKSVTEISR